MVLAVSIIVSIKAARLRTVKSSSSPCFDFMPLAQQLFYFALHLVDNIFIFGLDRYPVDVKVYPSCGFAPLSAVCIPRHPDPGRQPIDLWLPGHRLPETVLY